MSQFQMPASEELIGQLIENRYRIDSELGHGGMASIFLAWDTRLDRQIVVKIPHRDLVGDVDLRRRFLAEVRDLSAHEHPHILAIQDSGEHNGAPFAVMQYLGGGDLGRRLRDAGGKMSAEQVLAWLRPIALAVDYIHSKGCLHRDIKPANILFDDAGHPYLADFGISAALDIVSPETETLAPRDQMTRVGSFVGSAAYAPPESVDRVLTPAYDQYSLATVVYLALCGELPFEGSTSEAILIAKSRMPPTPIQTSSLEGKLSAHSQRAVIKALSKNPEDRFDSCLSFVAAFAGTASVTRSRVSGRPLALAAAAIAAAALVVGAIGLWSGRDGLDAPPTQQAAARQLEPGPGVVELGSTAAEREAALALCQRYDDECDASEFEGETSHLYKIVPSQMDRHEVTNAAFGRFVAAERLATLAERQGFSWDGPTRRTGLSWRLPADGLSARLGPELPVVHVTFEEARSYCEAAQGRLPSADEWEYHARGEARRVFPWGDEWDATRLRWTSERSVGLEPVASHLSGATPEKIVDLAGSVWEWTISTTEQGQILKGASWDLRNPAYFRSAAFAVAAPGTTSSDIGFRCVRDP